MPVVAPSTVAPNPLAEGMARIVGQDPLSTSTGTSSLIDYEGDPGRLPPAGDIITIKGDPGTGATTAEQWAHEIALENQRRDLMQFEFTKRIQEAEEQRAANMYGAQVAAINLQNAATQQQMAENAAAERRLADTYARERAGEALTAEAGRKHMDMTRFLNGQALSGDAIAEYQRTGGQGTFNPNQDRLRWPQQNRNISPGY